MRRLKLRIQNSRLGVLAGGILAHPLFSGSAVMVVGSNLANFLAYIYHVIVGRLLGPAPYGSLAAVLSLIGLVASSFTFLGLVIVKFVSAAKASERPALFSWFIKKALIFGFILAFLVTLATPFLSSFLHIDYSILLLIGPIFLFFVLGYFYRSFLQGLLRFKEMVVSANFDMGGRLLLGILFVYLGMSVFGAILGMLLATFLGLILLRFFLRQYRVSKAKSKFSGGKRVFAYTVPLFLATISAHSIFSTDVILVKHFLPAHTAGMYAALSNLGKIIFYGTSPILSVMFPMVSQRHARGQDYKKILIYTIFLSGAVASGIVFVYYLFPELMIKILYGEKFIEAAPNLVWFGIFMAIFTLASLFLNFYLSKDDTKVAYFALTAAIAQALGIWVFHDSILTVIKVSIISASFLLASLLIYFGYESKNNKVS